MFVDRVRVQLKAGDGGAGVVSFQKMRGRPHGKPVGGSGGKGGDVTIIADTSVSTLLRYLRSPHQAAGSGSHGSGDMRHGKSGQDLEITVPPGTLIYDDSGELLADLAVPGQSILALSGGKGGRGNAAFLSPSNRTPAVCEQGEYGPERWFTFELKLIADAALVGFPNAGKSTLIRSVSAARPKVADYPFTTTEPNLGVVSAGDTEFVLVDVPGLIEGASAGKGLGLEFLRHIERAGVLIYLLDPSPWQEHLPSRQLQILQAEVSSYSAELADRPHLVVVGKADLSEAKEIAQEFAQEIAECHLISGLTGAGCEELMYQVSGMIDFSRRWVPDREGYKLHRPVGEDIKVVKVGDGWRVEGEAAVRAVGFSDLTLEEAADLAADRLRRLGVEKVLERAGVATGDTIKIGDLSFEWTPDPTEPHK